MPAAVAVVALAHQFGKFCALPDKVTESVVCDLRSGVTRREVLCVKSHAEDLLLESEDASASAETPKLERLAAATRQVAPAVTQAHEVGEFLRGNVVHLRGVLSTCVFDRNAFFCFNLSAMVSYKLI
jgi:hypothetical protein